MKKIAFVLLAGVTGILLFSFSSISVLEEILDKLEAYTLARPQEKLYLHLDKPAYSAGDNLWFKGYLLEAHHHTPDSSSRLVYVELTDSAHYLIKREVLYLTDGTVMGDFYLPDTLAEGRYLVRAYTNYMKNAGEGFFFHRQIEISNAKRRQSAEAGIHETALPDLQFFPEGGDLVACGRYNRVAFKATGSDGRGLTVSGTVVDDDNVVVARFNSAHAGLGSFNLNPQKGKSYTAHITTPAGINQAYPLPEVHNEGYVLHVDKTGGHIKILAFVKTDNPGAEINLVVQSRGVIYYAEEGKLQGDTFVTLVPREDLPNGVSQITLFDGKGRPVAERLIFEDKAVNLDISISTGSLRYSKRSPVTIDLDAAYPDGTPAAGNFSLSVYNDDQSKNFEQYPLTLENYLSLTSDLRGQVENPGYYLKDTLQETYGHRDLLMMTHGWRRFTWTDVLSPDISTPQQYEHERGLNIRGMVVGQKKKGKPFGPLKIMTMAGDVVVIQPDSAGRFSTDQLFYYDSTTLVFQTENEKGKKQPGQVQLSPFTPVPENEYPVMGQEHDIANVMNNFQNQPQFSSRIKVLDAVVVAEKREPDQRLLGGPTDRVIETKKLSSGFHNVLQLMQSQLPGVIVTGTPPNISISIRRSAPVFMMNGNIIPNDAVPELSTENLEKVEILQGASAARYGARSLVNFIYGISPSNRPAVGISKAKYPGLYEARQFYSPRYNLPDPKQADYDSRTTLLWKPVVKTDSHGHAKLQFYTGDTPSQYRIVIEGITADGIPGTATKKTFTVK